MPSFCLAWTDRRFQGELRNCRQGPADPLRGRAAVEGSGLSYYVPSESLSPLMMPPLQPTYLIPSPQSSRQFQRSPDGPRMTAPLLPETLLPAEQSSRTCLNSSGSIRPPSDAACRDSGTAILPLLCSKWRDLVIRRLPWTSGFRDVGEAVPGIRDAVAVPVHGRGVQLAEHLDDRTGWPA